MLVVLPPFLHIVSLKIKKSGFKKLFFDFLVLGKVKIYIIL